MEVARGRSTLPKFKKQVSEKVVSTKHFQSRRHQMKKQTTPLDSSNETTKKNIWFTKFGDGQKSAVPGKKRGKWDSSKGKFEQTTSYGDGAKSIGFISRNQGTFIFGSSPSDLA